MRRMDECSPRGMVKLHLVWLRAGRLDIHLGVISSVPRLQVAHFGCRKRCSHGLGVAHFSHQDHVGCLRRDMSQQELYLLGRSLGQIQAADGSLLSRRRLYSIFTSGVYKRPLPTWLFLMKSRTSLNLTVQSRSENAITPWTVRKLFCPCLSPEEEGAHLRQILAYFKFIPPTILTNHGAEGCSVIEKNL